MRANRHYRPVSAVRFTYRLCLLVGPSSMMHSAPTAAFFRLTLVSVTFDWSDARVVVFMWIFKMRLKQFANWLRRNNGRTSSISTSNILNIVSTSAKYTDTSIGPMRFRCRRCPSSSFSRFFYSRTYFVATAKKRIESWSNSLLLCALTAEYVCVLVFVSTRDVSLALIRHQIKMPMGQRRSISSL